MSQPTELDLASMRVTDLLALAGAPETSAAVLEQLASHWDPILRVAVAANSSTPRSTIKSLLARSSEPDLIAAVLGNPSVLLWLLDSPAWFHGLSDQVAASLAHSPANTPLVWDALRGHESVGVRVALLTSPAAPPGAWRALGFASELDALLARVEDESQPQARQALIEAFVAHPGVLPRLLAAPTWLIEEPTWRQQQERQYAHALARSPALTPRLWEALRAHEHVRVRLALLRSPVAPPDAWQQLDLPTGSVWDLSNQNLELEDVIDLAGRPQLAALTGLTLSSNGRDRGLGEVGVSALARSPFVAGLASLDLSNLGVGKAGVQALAQSTALPRLTTLSLSDNALGEVGPEVLARLASLDQVGSLDLSSCGLGDADLTALFDARGLAGVTSLDLSRNQLGAASLQALARWAPPGQLTALDLSNCQLGDDDLFALARSTALAGLTSLDLSNNQLGLASMEFLFKSPILTSLVSLDLSSNPLLDAGVGVLARSPLLRDLTSLDLSASRLGPAAMTALVGAAFFPRLLSLNLSSNTLLDSGVSTLAQVAGVTRLTSLDLGETLVSHRGLAELARSDAFPHLRELNLMINQQVNDQALATLARSTTLRALTYLCLDDTAVGDVGLEALAQADLPHLAELGLAYTSVTERGVMALARSASLPQLRQLNLHMCQHLSDELRQTMASVSFFHTPTLGPAYLFTR